MSNEDTDKLEGAALDEAVAHEVMGFVESTSDFYQWQDANGNPVNDAVYGPWSPTKDIALAFEVINAVINKMDGTCSFSVSGVFPGSGDTPACFADFQPCIVLSSPAPFRGEGDNVQEAICRAALKAIRSARATAPAKEQS